jgi:hypothetical protein
MQFKFREVVVKEILLDLSFGLGPKNPPGEVAPHFKGIPALAGRAADPLRPHPCEMAIL